MNISGVISYLESQAHPSLQEGYDNAGLITGSPNWECTGIVCCLDAIEEVVKEAIKSNCNLIVAHHPIIFSGLKKINGKNYVERAIIMAIKHDIAIYAIHTNLDNVISGVSGKMAAMLGLKDVKILAPRNSGLRKLFTFVPLKQAAQVRDALFEAGAGHIGKYSECSFNVQGEGTYRAGEGAQPFIGEVGKRHTEPELKIEVIFPAWLQRDIISALTKAHPYEEVAFDVTELANEHITVGSGVIGEFSEALGEDEFLGRLRSVFEISVVRHTNLSGRKIRKIALCGGAGSFLISKALQAGADAYVTADLKYHEFFDADSKLLLADIGHYESEQFTISLLHELLVKKFPTFAVLKTGVNTNPVRYFS